MVHEVAAQTDWATANEASPLTASDDFARYLQKAPGILFGVGAGESGAFPHHHPKFTINERSIWGMCEILLQCAMAATSTYPPSDSSGEFANLRGSRAPDP
jgi:metal-dependent amidase/aminoacylase/carboxypeptidase family protein